MSLGDNLLTGSWTLTNVTEVTDGYEVDTNSFEFAPSGNMYQDITAIDFVASVIEYQLSLGFQYAPTYLPTDHDAHFWAEVVYNFYGGLSDSVCIPIHPNFCSTVTTSTGTWYVFEHVLPISIDSLLTSVRVNIICDSDTVVKKVGNVRFQKVLTENDVHTDTDHPHNLPLAIFVNQDGIKAMKGDDVTFWLKDTGDASFAGELVAATGTFLGTVTVGAGTVFEDGYDASIKRRVFVATPTPPYDVGDLWVEGATGDFRKCGTAKGVGGIYDIADWPLASKYTDDTIANTKARVFVQGTMPVPDNEGDIWIDSSDQYKVYTWDGSSWTNTSSIAEATAGLGVDADCRVLYHFNGSANPHNKIASSFIRNTPAYQIDENYEGEYFAENEPRFGTGRFGQGIFLEQATCNIMSQYQSSLNFSAHWWTLSTYGLRDATDGPYSDCTLSITNPLAVNECSTVVDGIKPSTTYTFSFECKTSLTSLRINVVDLNDMTSINTDVNNITVTTAKNGNTWKRYTFTWTTDANANGVLLRVITGESGTSGVAYFDAFQIEEKAYATSYHDGANSDDQLLSVVQDIEDTDISEFTAIDSTLTRVTTEYYRGLASLRVVTGTTNAYGGVEAPALPLLPNTTYILTVRVKHAVAGLSMSLGVSKTAGGALYASTTYTSTTAWKSVRLEFTTDATTTYFLRVYKNNLAATAVTFYVDQFQLYLKNAREKEYIRIPAADVFNPSAFTVSMNYTPTVDITGMHVLFEYYIDDSNRILLYHSAATVYAQMRSGGTDKEVNGGTLTLDTVALITMTYDGTTLRLYIDGTEVGTPIAATLPIGTAPTYMYLGDGVGRWLTADGVIDECRIDQVCKTAEEIRAWFVAQSPFYSVQELTTMPGYMEMTTEGIKIYDVTGDLRVILGSWMFDETTRKYGLKIIDGELYSSLVNTGTEGDDSNYAELANDGSSGYLKFIGDSAQPILDIYASSDQGKITWYDAGVRKAAVMINGTVTKDLWISTWDGNGIYLSADSGESIAIGPYGGQFVEGIMLDGKIRSTLLPKTTTTYDLGSSSYKWNLIRGLTITSGDLAFDEEECAICGERFADGDILVLLVKTIDDTCGTLTIPVHDRCKAKKVQREVKVPVSVKKYDLNEKGEVFEYYDLDYEEVEQEYIMLKPGIELDPDTGEFYRAPKHSANKQLYTDEELKAKVVVSKANALCTNVETRRVPKTKTITITLGGNSDNLKL